MEMWVSKFACDVNSRTSDMMVRLRKKVLKIVRDPQWKSQRIVIFEFKAKYLRVMVDFTVIVIQR